MIIRPNILFILACLWGSFFQAYGQTKPTESKAWWAPERKVIKLVVNQSYSHDGKKLNLNFPVFDLAKRVIERAGFKVWDNEADNSYAQIDVAIEGSPNCAEYIDDRGNRMRRCPGASITGVITTSASPKRFEIRGETGIVEKASHETPGSPLTAPYAETLYPVLLRQLVNMMSEISDKNYIDIYAASLRDEEYLIRKQSVMELGNIHDDYAATCLVTYLMDGRTNADVKPEIEKSINSILRNIEADAMTVDLYLSGLDPKINNKGELRMGFAAHALGEIKNPIAVPRLVESLKSEDPELRREAAWALGEIRDARALEPLAALCHGEMEMLRKNDFKDMNAGHPLSECLPAIGKLRDPRAVEFLIPLVEDEALVLNVRAWSVLALGGCESPRAFDTLMSVLNKKNTPIKAQPESQKGATNDSLEAADVARSLQAKAAGEAMRTNAVVALGRMKDPRTLDALASRLLDKSESPLIRDLAARALGDKKDLRAMGPLIEALQDKTLPDYKNVVAALVSISGEGDYAGDSVKEWRKIWQRLQESKQK